MTDVRILSDPLGGSALSRLLQTGDAPPRWLPAAPRSPDAWRARAAARRDSDDWTARLSALAPAFHASGDAAAERLARVQREGGVIVTTGQQPGLFGGPIYTWSKAVGTIALAEALERHTGIPTAPVFWAATDDADFAEASVTAVPRSGGAEWLRATDAPPPGTPMSLAPLGDTTAALRSLREACGSVVDPRALEAVMDAYGNPATTVGDAFVRLLRALLQPLGMAVLDASHPAVRAASETTLHTARRGASAVESALVERAGEIDAAGLAPQVEDVAGLSLVFVRDGSAKRRLTVAEAAQHAGGWYTPNVLLRPIVEQAILPTVAYLAGPGELAYFAQVSAVAEALGIPAPVALPRWSCTLVEPHIASLMTELGTSLEELAVPAALEGRLARGAMHRETTEALASLRATIAALPARLKIDSETTGLERAVEGGAQNLSWRVDRLERRLLAGVKRREMDQMRKVATLRGAILPFGRRQERTLNAIPLFARHGLELLDEMRRAAAAHADRLVARSAGARTMEPAS